MASKFLHEAQRGASRGSIDLPVAIVAGLSVGFVAFMLPGDILARLVEMSRLPDVFPPAAPPLGTKAQAAFALAAAGATIATVYFLLRLIGGRSAEPRPQLWPEVDTEREPETPRLRRSDVHPDAPARRPILAARELGEPDPTPAPVWPERSVPAEPEAAIEPEEEPLDLGGPGTEMLEAEPEGVILVVPVVEEAVVPEPVLDEPVFAEPVEPAPPPRAPDPVGDESIAELMNRLERGLARRAVRKAPLFVSPVEPAPAEAPAPVPEYGDDRLRSAIENLQRMAARAG